MDHQPEWTGLAILVSVSEILQTNPDHSMLTCSYHLCQGGSFLYIATVLQPVSDHADASPDTDYKQRVVLIIVGMFIPVAIASIIGHGH
jgi:hypothetical protein